MKKIFFIIPVLALVCCMALSAAAEEIQVPPSANPIIAAPAFAAPTLGAVQQPKPAQTTPLAVALTYYKLTGRVPDFDSWVKQQDSYKNANAFDQNSMVAPMVQRLKDAYGLILLSDPVVVETQVALSAYDKKNLGYSVESFKASTFFPSTYGGQSYAIVPINIADKQWLKVDDPETVAAIEKAATANDRLLTMIIYLTPKYADANSPASIDGENYWPMVTDIQKMMLYAPNSDTMLWQSIDVSASDKTSQKIMKLYQ
jgi:hypothetical protein